MKRKFYILSIVSFISVHSIKGIASHTQNPINKTKQYQENLEFFRPIIKKGLEDRLNHSTYVVAPPQNTGFFEKLKNNFLKKVSPPSEDRNKDYLVEKIIENILSNSQVEEKLNQKSLSEFVLEADDLAEKMINNQCYYGPMKDYFDINKKFSEALKEEMIKKLSDQLKKEMIKNRKKPLKEKLEKLNEQEKNFYFEFPPEYRTALFKAWHQQKSTTDDLTEQQFIQDTIRDMKDKNKESLISPENWENYFQPHKYFQPLEEKKDKKNNKNVIKKSRLKKTISKNWKNFAVENKPSLSIWSSLIKPLLINPSNLLSAIYLINYFGGFNLLSKFYFNKN